VRRLRHPFPSLHGIPIEGMPRPPAWWHGRMWQQTSSASAWLTHWGTYAIEAPQRPLAAISADAHHDCMGWPAGEDGWA
jgi:hypothetical protein